MKEADHDSHRQTVHAWPQPGGAPAQEIPLRGQRSTHSKVGNKVILEPLQTQPFDAAAWFARLDELGARDFLPDGLPDDPPVEPDPRKFFDE